MRYIILALLTVIPTHSSTAHADLDVGESAGIADGTVSVERIPNAKECVQILFGGGKESGASVLPVSRVRIPQPKWDTFTTVSDPELYVKLIYSVIYVESRGNPKALSPADAYGMMQVTEAAAYDAAKYCSMPPLPSPEYLFDMQTNIKFGSCYLKKLLSEVDNDIPRALVAYNGGYRQLTLYDREGNIATETANYVLKVTRTLRRCTEPTLLQENN